MMTLKIDRGDWVIDAARGAVATVSGADKLRQDVRQMLATSPQVNGFGAGLDSLVGIAYDPATTQFALLRLLRAAVATMQRLQSRQRAYRAPEERLLRLASLRIEPSAIGGDARTGIAYTLAVVSEAGDAVQAAGVIA